MPHITRGFDEEWNGRLDEGREHLLVGWEDSETDDLNLTRSTQIESMGRPSQEKGIRLALGPQAPCIQAEVAQVHTGCCVGFRPMS